VTSAPCPSEAELSRALGAAPGAELARHLSACETCQATWAGLSAAIAHARQLHARPLPSRVPDEERRDEVRAALLARAALPLRHGASRPSWAVGATALASCVIVALWLTKTRPAAAPAPSRVVVRSGPGARYAVVSPPPWETIHLWDGSIDLEVEPLHPGERVRVEVGDGEVEVRGTRFQVVARADRLVGVDVTHGRVEVRPRGASVAVLGVGERWRSVADGPEVAPPPPAVAAREAPPEAREPRPRRDVEPRFRQHLTPGAGAAIARALRPTREEGLYDDAWDALRARRFEEAAAGFGRILAESPTCALADEAGFWRATALARGGRSSEAIAAFRAFLDSTRTSSRRGEASVILGWMLVDAHRPDEARGLFRAAAADPHATVSASAREGMKALGN
jgi:TolA-binding protein